MIRHAHRTSGATRRSSSSLMRMVRGPGVRQGACVIVLFVLVDALRTDGAPHSIYGGSRDMHPRNGGFLNFDPHSARLHRRGARAPQNRGLKVTFKIQLKIARGYGA